MRERKTVPFLLALSTCTVINRVCLEMIAEISTQIFDSNDQVFVYAAAGHGQQSSSAAFAEAQGVFTFHSTNKLAVKTLQGV